jgi:hypothetical protein
MPTFKSVWHENRHALHKYAQKGTFTQLNVCISTFRNQTRTLHYWLWTRQIFHLGEQNWRLPKRLLDSRVQTKEKQHKLQAKGGGLGDRTIEPKLSSLELEQNELETRSTALHS